MSSAVSNIGLDKLVFFLFRPFDYLRDNMKYDLETLVQRKLNYAIIDEIDSVLIDEARTPPIISGPADDQSEKYKISDKAVLGLKAGLYQRRKSRNRIHC